MKLCEIESCERLHYARGWCQAHYRRWTIHGSPDVLIHAFPARFWSKVTVIESGCWEWLGACGRDGYGRAADEDGAVRLAHRISYRLNKGPVPDGLHVDHLCRNRRCVNPGHLEAVTQQVNNERANVKTHCLRGHPFAGDNVYVKPSGQRECRACQHYRQAVKNLASLDAGTDDRESA